MKFVYNTLNVFLETTLRFSPTFLKVTVSKLIYMCTCNIYDRIRSAFGLKSASTPKISIHWNHNLKSLRVSVWHRSWEIIWHCCQNDRLFQNKWPKRPTHAMYASDTWSSILQFVHNLFWLKLFYCIIYRYPCCDEVQGHWQNQSRNLRYALMNGNINIWNTRTKITPEQTRKNYRISIWRQI